MDLALPACLPACLLTCLPASVLHGGRAGGGGRAAVWEGGRLRPRLPACLPPASLPAAERRDAAVDGGMDQIGSEGEEEESKQQSNEENKQQQTTTTTNNQRAREGRPGPGAAAGREDGPAA